MKTKSISISNAWAVALSFFLFSFTIVTDFDGKAPNKDGDKITEAQKIAYNIFPLANSNKIRVAYQKTGDMPVTVRIYDHNMHLLFSDTQRDANYMYRNYIMDVDGCHEFVVKLMAGDFTTVHRIDLSTKKPEKFAMYLAPQLYNNKVRIAFQHAKAPVHMHIYDQEKKLIYQQTIHEDSYSSVKIATAVFSTCPRLRRESTRL